MAGVFCVIHIKMLNLGGLEQKKVRRQMQTHTAHRHTQCPTHYLKRAGRKRFTFFLSSLNKGGKTSIFQSQPGAVITREKKCKSALKVFCLVHSSLLGANLDSEVGGGILNILFRQQLDSLS